MTALHYAAYFDVVPVLQLLLSLPEGKNKHISLLVFLRFWFLMSYTYQIFHLSCLINSKLLLLGLNVDDPCAEYDLGTPLHMAAANLCIDAAKVLLHYGASRTARDARGRTPRGNLLNFFYYIIRK